MNTKKMMKLSELVVFFNGGISFMHGIRKLVVKEENRGIDITILVDFVVFIFYLELSFLSKLSPNNELIKYFFYYLKLFAVFKNASKSRPDSNSFTV